MSIADRLAAASAALFAQPVAPPQQRADASFGGATIVPTVGYEGASQTRRLSPWRVNRGHINAILAAEGELLRARSRHLVANSAYGANASETFVAYATGAGIKPSSLIADPARKKAVQQAWLDWTDEADADGLTDFYGLQSLAARALFDAGEVFVRLRPRRAEDGLSVPLQLQLLEAEQLDLSMNYPAANGNPIRQGIEFDGIGRRVAYHFWRTHPGDSTIQAYQGERTRVPASEVLHVYKPLRPGQIRGRPWLSAGMVKLYELDQYDDAELVRKKIAAMFTTFLSRGVNADAAAEMFGSLDPTASTALEIDATLEPGAVNVLPDGVTVTNAAPADVGGSYEAFQFRNLLGLCAAMGLPYSSVTGDVSKANYSSLRASLVELKRRIEQFQHETLIFQFCRPVWARWLESAVLAGAVSLPGFARDRRAMTRTKWIPPKWEWVDPLKDLQAEKLAVDSGFKARADVVEASGYDVEEVDARIAQDKAREETLGLAFAPAQHSTSVQPEERVPPPPADEQDQDGRRAA